MTRHRNRRAIAIVACALWLLGVEALPALHAGTHRADHTHARDGSIHRHGDRVHAHGKPAKPRKQHQLAFDDVPSGHVAGGLAHHAVAYSPAAPPILAPLPVDRPSRLIEHAPEVVLVGVAIARARARGPPA